MLYYIAKGLLRFSGFFMFRIKTVGKENVPENDGAIFAVNHRSNWDPVLVAMTSPRRMSFMAKSELFKNKLFGALLRRLGAFPVHRGKGDIGAIKTALSILKDGKIMIIFPEGKRIRDGERADIKPGVAMIATHAKVPVVPVSVTGKYRWMHKMTVSYGEPIFLDEYYGEKLSIEKLTEISTSIMNRVYSMSKAAEKK